MSAFDKLKPLGDFVNDLNVQQNNFWSQKIEVPCPKCLKHLCTCPLPEISTAKTDMVNKPPHYTSGKIECIDAITEAIRDLNGIEAKCTGDAIKYLWRWKKKNGVEDLKKAVWYINHLIKLNEK